MCCRCPMSGRPPELCPPSRSVAETARVGHVDEAVVVQLCSDGVDGRSASAHSAHQIRPRDATHTLSQAADEHALRRPARRQAKESWLQPRCLIRLSRFSWWSSPLVWSLHRMMSTVWLCVWFFYPFCTLLKTVVLVFWLCTFVSLWIVLWATHGLPLRASVYRGCPCRDPPMCLDAWCGIKAKRQPFVVVRVWSCQCLVVFQTRST